MDTITTGEAATILGVSSQTVRRIIAAGEIKAIQIAVADGWYRILRDDLQRYAETRGIELDWSLIDKQ